MYLILDVGKSSIKAGLYSGSILQRHQVYHHMTIETLSLFLQGTKTKHAIVSTVGEPEGIPMKDLRHLFPDLLELNHHTALPFLNQYKTPASLGYDRIAGVAGALAEFPGQPILVIDAGTAITFDFLSPEGRYPGGNISPGLSLRFKSLHQFTSRLPWVEYQPGVPLIGHSTEEAILAGVVQGVVFEIEGYISALSLQYPDLAVVLTGGDAPRLANRIKKAIFASPFLVLNGLNLILQHNLNLSMPRLQANPS
jgi:type III pantothenate kinase